MHSQDCSPLQMASETLTPLLMASNTMKTPKMTAFPPKAPLGSENMAEVWETLACFPGVEACKQT